MEEFIKSLRKSTAAAYDYLCKNSDNLSRSELLDIAKELVYAGGPNPDVRLDAADELEELYGE